MIMSLVSRLWWRRYLRRNGRPWDELDTFRQLSPEEQRSILAKRLFDQIQYFGRRADALPEWRDAARAENPDELWKLWPQLPIIGKKTINERFQADEIQQRFALRGRVDSTGGSTGEPTHFFHDFEMLRAMASQNAYTMVRMGWRPGMPVISVWGSERDIGRHVAWKIRLFYWLTRQYHVDGYSLDQQTVDRVVASIRRYRHSALYGFTSMLEFVAESIVERGINVPAGAVKVAWNGGEILHESQKRIFQKAFGAPLLNRYGGRELATMACQLSPTEALTVLRPWLFLEVIDESGKPVKPGESGRLVWTSTICRGTPFLRYEVEDWGTFEPAHINESGVGALVTIDGRSAGVITLSNGQRINNIYWNHLFKEFEEVRQFQVVLRREGGIRLLLRGSQWSTGREGDFRAILRNFLGELPAEIQWVEQIPPTHRGKRVQVVREA